MIDIFALTTRPDPELFYRRGDPNDVRLGEVVSSSPDQYQAADIVILGCPQDDGVARNKGRIGAKEAPTQIRRCFYKWVAFSEEAPLIFDLGNTQIGPTLEDTHDRHQAIMRQLIRDGKTIIVLGGGNDVAYPDVSALASEIGKIHAISVDAHFDVRADLIRNSGTPYRQLLEEGALMGDSFHVVGYQPFANSKTYINYLNRKDVELYSIDELFGETIPKAFEYILNKSRSEAIFWGLDMDVVCGADAPGVSAVNPLGLRANDFCKIAFIAGQEERSRIFEITEVNPRYDVNDLTCRLASVAMYQFILGFMDR
ncbi:formimidoylglutamase [Anaerolineales bacterium]